MAVALNLYLDNYDRYPLSIGPGPDPDYAQTWQDALAPYLSEKTTNSTFRFLRCPSYKQQGSAAVGSGFIFIPFSIYAYNSGTPYALSPTPNDYYTPTYLKESSVVVPSRMIAMGDANLVAYATPSMVMGATDLRYIPLSYRRIQPGYEREQKVLRPRHYSRHVTGFATGTWRLFRLLFCSPTVPKQGACGTMIISLIPPFTMSADESRLAIAQDPFPSPAMCYDG